MTDILFVGYKYPKVVLSKSEEYDFKDFVPVTVKTEDYYWHIEEIKCVNPKLKSRLNVSEMVKFITNRHRKDINKAFEELKNKLNCI